ncbi:MAG: DUF3465 domain-containing protein [Chloroflexi bacterium]|nr:MAG: DUF3465 domain-containing protein [Chloroflexota bacterium]
MQACEYVHRRHSPEQGSPAVALVSGAPFPSLYRRRIPARALVVTARSFLLLALLIAPACTPPTPDNAAVERAFAEHRSQLEITAEGSVTQVLTDDNGPAGTHQRFIVRLTSSTQTVLIDNNVSIGRRVPVAPGDAVIVHGEYVWNQQGGLVHFTHHDPAHTHESGWIERAGTRYD